MAEGTALYKFTCEVYWNMHNQGKVNEHDERVFEGKLTRVFRQVGASTTYYTPIRKLLLSPINDPCIIFDQRGNSSQLSIIRLLHPPPQEWERITHRDLTAAREGAILTEELERQVKSLLAWRESLGEVNLSEALRNIERRLSRLEQERGKTGNGKTKKV